MSDITEAIRSEEVGMNASRVAALPAVRTAGGGPAAALSTAPGLVADGRDMGTVIFFQTPCSRCTLTASAEQRPAPLPAVAFEGHTGYTPISLRGLDFAR